MAEEWDSVIRQNHKYRGGANPPVIYDFSPPFLFDFRIKSTRRMGIGDQICLLTAIQGVADKIGPENVSIWYDPAYLGSADIFPMGGLSAIPISAFSGDVQEYAKGYTVIPCRGHIMDCPLGGEHICYYGEHTGNPLDEIYYSWGWHNLIRGGDVCPRLYPPRDAVAEAQRIAANIMPFVCCTPLEVSRHNNNCTPEKWGEVLNQSDSQPLILFGCAPKERSELESMIDGMNLNRKYQIISVSLQTWKALIDLASASYTGNSCGLWLSMASKTMTYLLQHDDPNHTHNHMWSWKKSWKTKNIILLNA